MNKVINLYKKGFNPVLLIVCVVVLSTLIVWLPFWLRFPIWGINVGTQGLGKVITNYDGPYYIAIAKTLYNPVLLKDFEFTLPIEYYPAHFPLYPLLIRIFAIVVGYPYSSILIPLLSTIGAAIVFYKLARYLKFANPLFLTIVFLFLPARFLIARTVSSPEPLFILMTLWSIYSFLKKDYWTSGITGGFAQLTKPPGMLLGLAYFISLLINFLPKFINKPSDINNYFPWKALPLIIIPLSLVSLFGYYGYVYGSFWAYFQSGDNIHLFWPPFQVFNTEAFWVGTFWLEDIIWLMLLITISVIKLWQRRDVISIYVMVFAVSLAFVQHRDIPRYALPLAPFLVLAFAELITHKFFKVAFYIMLLPIYLYAVNFISGNYVPVSDWTKLL